MVAKIYQYAGAEDLKAYLDGWASTDPLGAHGVFYDDGIDSQFEQWAGGNESGRSDNSVLLEGNFDYPANGGFTGMLDSLDFGTNMTGYPSGPFDITGSDLKLHVDLGGASANSTFNYAVYQLMGTGGTASAAGLYNYFGSVGTEQHGTTGDDTQYSFAGNDTFIGDLGNDTFVFESNWATDVITDFGSSTGDTDTLDFTGVAAIVDVNDLVYNYSNWYDSSSVLTISDGTNVVTLTGYVGADILTLQSNGQLLA
jgi:hypothetical protein